MVVAVAVAVAVAEKNTTTHGKKKRKNETKSVKFRFGELSICRICAESRDLGPEHGFRACSLKNKGKKLDFHMSGVKKTKKQVENLDEIGQNLVSRALNDTEKIR